MLDLPNPKLPASVYLNDPSSPDLVEEVLLPDSLSLPITVEGFGGGGVNTNSPSGRASQCYATIARVLANISPFVELKTWHTANGSLNVIPNAGRQWNANYDRRNLNFFSNVDYIRNKDVFTSLSTDVVAHELGHAILDTIRPDLWNFAMPEITAFHEAFGDFCGVATIAQSAAVIEKVILETKSDLSQSNLLSRISEEVGCGLYGVPPGDVGCLRDLANNFKYSEMSMLKRSGTPNELSSEVHSFSRIMSGCLYEISVLISKKLRELGFEEIKSIQSGFNLVLKRVFEAAKIVPATSLFFKAFGSVFLAVDRQMGGLYYDLIDSVLQKRNLKSTTSVSACSFPDSDAVETLDTEAGKIVVFRKIKEIKISSLDQVRMAEYNPLYELKIKLPLNSCVTYDRQDVPINAFSSDESHAIDSARCFLDYLHETSRVGENKEFSIINGELERNFICGFPPSPYSPEYYKPYKPENNTGCGCGKPSEEVKKTEVKKGCYIRYNAGKGCRSTNSPK